jgi:hypothetical protein
MLMDQLDFSAVNYFIITIWIGAKIYIYMDVHYLQSPLFMHGTGAIVLPGINKNGRLPQDPADNLDVIKQAL